MKVLHTAQRFLALQSGEDVKTSMKKRIVFTLFEDLDHKDVGGNAATTKHSPKFPHPNHRLWE